MKKFIQAGFAPVVGLVAIVALVIGLTAAVLVVRNQVGLNTKASGSTTTTLTGKLVKPASCVLSVMCYQINRTTVVSIGDKIKLENYLNKTVTVTGILQTTRGVTILAANKITLDIPSPTVIPSASIKPSPVPTNTSSANPKNVFTGKIIKASSTYQLIATDKKTYYIFPSSYEKVSRYENVNVKITGQLITDGMSALLPGSGLLIVDTITKI